MRLFLLKDNMIRLKVDEASPLKPRYEVPDAIVKQLVPSRLANYASFFLSYWVSVHPDLFTVISNAGVLLIAYIFSTLTCCF